MMQEVVGLTTSIEPIEFENCPLGMKRTLHPTCVTNPDDMGAVQA